MQCEGQLVYMWCVEPNTYTCIQGIMMKKYLTSIQSFAPFLHF